MANNIKRGAVLGAIRRGDRTREYWERLKSAVPDEQFAAECAHRVAVQAQIIRAQAVAALHVLAMERDESLPKHLRFGAWEVRQQLAQGALRCRLRGVIDPALYDINSLG